MGFRQWVPSWSYKVDSGRFFLRFRYFKDEMYDLKPKIVVPLNYTIQTFQRSSSDFINFQ